jgi:hypothetical protein
MTSPVPRKRYRTNSDSECVTESLMARKKYRYPTTSNQFNVNLQLRSENHPEILYVPRSIHSSNDMTSCVVQNRVLSPVLTDGLTLAPCSSGTQDPLDENRLTATGILYGNEAGESSNNQLNDLFFIECPANVDCKNGIITGYPYVYCLYSFASNLTFKFITEIL